MKGRDNDVERLDQSIGASKMLHIALALICTSAFLFSQIQGRKTQRMFVWLGTKAVPHD
jgi:hypothetical protein